MGNWDTEETRMSELDKGDVGTGNGELGNVGNGNERIKNKPNTMRVII